MAIPEMRTKAPGGRGVCPETHSQTRALPGLWATNAQVNPLPQQHGSPQAHHPGHSTSKCGCQHLLHTPNLLPNPLVKAPPLPSLGSRLLVIKASISRPAQRSTCLPWRRHSHGCRQTPEHAHSRRRAGGASAFHRWGAPPFTKCHRIGYFV